MQPQRRPSAAEDAPEPEQKLRELLREVHSLLESYAPTWYTEALSKKIEAALKD